MVPRSLNPDIEDSLNNFQIVGLIGSRQCGKTTLAKAIAGKRPGTVYLDLERPSDLGKLEEAELYLEHVADRLVILDEIQRKPDLFPLLRSLVDTDPDRTGRFLILGSASPDLIKQASETLAGRIAYHELAPFSLLEVEHPDHRRLWVRGGYPRSFLARSDDQSRGWRDAFIRTYLERDIPQLGIRIPALQLRRFWTMLAHSHGQLWNASKIAGSLGVAAPTVRRYLDILHDTFVIRQLQPYHPNLRKRLVKSPKVYLRDSGLLYSLLGIRDMESLLGSPYAGPSWEGWVIEQIRASVPPAVSLHFYRTSAGAEVDVVLVPPGKPPVAVEIKFTARPRVSKGFRISMEDLRCRRGFMVCPVGERYPLSGDVTVLPVEAISELAASI